MTDEPAETIPLEVAIHDIIYLNEYIHDFWQRGAAGWSPAEAAHLLQRSRLDRQVSLSRCLRLWLDEPPDAEREGQLILAWTNLGSLVEGTMTWYLCVWEHAYATNPMQDRSGNDLAPDALHFDELCRFFDRAIWADGDRDEWHDWCKLVRQRRNAIHAYRDRDIGTWPELQSAIRKYRDFVNDLNCRVPYPDELSRLDYRVVDLFRAEAAKPKE